MLCTFTELSHLNRTPASITENGDDIVVFRAEEEGVGSFYAILVPTKKIGLAEDSRTVMELKSHFPQVSESHIHTVWKTQNDWGACFDVLNSLRNSNESKSCLLDSCSFLLDSISWPKLDHKVSSQSFVSGKWKISEVQSLSCALGGLALSDPTGELGSWELLSHPTPPPAEGKGRGTVRSYREALLKSPPKQAENNESEGARKRLNSSSTTAWKPTIVVQGVKHEHKDKLYQHNLVALGLPLNPMYEPDEDDDAGGGGSYFQSNEFAKGSVSLTRTRASTMLKPAALEKKMARMASRAALRPPVPGGGGSDDSDSD
eukprot:CAMPEP_0184966524 /NCGR_PEP_ID=MMETSP1098-20130426/158_1 /TAXON_ID=89044 /ORGANISM="Spumella elongata, Strain CCAP 955/1" /LENGTH=316 /DNA_ID=CAMNT_0027487803 /DNA_START=166 /DNA_END=1116 /DNA_ORIENTATION=+